MAARKTTAKKSPAQVKANKAFAAAGRSAQARTRAAAIAKTGKPPPRTKKQQAATAKFVAAGRAAQAARRAGKTPAPKKAPKAPDPQLGLGPEVLDPTEPGLSLDLRPACAAVALAEHLYAATGIAVPDEDILRFAGQSGLLSLAGLLEYVALEGFCGYRLMSFRRCDEELAIPGLLYGLQLTAGYHAVLAHPAGVLTWGTVLPWPGPPAESWHLDWAA